MLPDAGQVGEAEVHHLNLGSHLQDIGYGLRHDQTPFDRVERHA